MLHLDGLLFASLTPALSPQRACRDKTRGSEEPARQDDSAAKTARLARQQDENRLDDLLRQLRVIYLTQCDGAHQSEVTVHQGAERPLGISLDIILQQLPVIHNQ